MDLARPLGALATLVAVAFVVGSLVSLVTGPILGYRSLASIVVVALVAVAVVGATVLGLRSREWLASGGYW
jgi:glycerol-3-phosphate acyltransferase PlsY